MYSSKTHEKLYISNVVLEAKPGELKDFLCRDVTRRPYFEVYVSVDKTGKSNGYAIAMVPKTYVRRVMKQNDKMFHGKAIKIHSKERMFRAKGNTYRWAHHENGVYKTTVNIPFSDSNITLPFQYKLVDCGAFLMDKGFSTASDIEYAISKATSCGVDKIVVKPETLSQTQSAKRLSELYPEVIYFSAALNVNDLHPAKEKIAWEKLKQLAMEPNCVAIGEVMLTDSKDVRDKERKEHDDQQTKMFEKYIEMAIHLHRPLLIFTNKEHKEVLNVLDKFSGRCPLVCVNSRLISESKGELDAYLSKGIYIVLNGYSWLPTYKIPLRHWLSQQDNTKHFDKILLASSSPHCNVEFITSYVNNPSYYRAVHKEELSGITQQTLDMYKNHSPLQRNEPCHLVGLAEVAAGCAEISAKKFAAICCQNAHNFFEFGKVKERTFSQEIEKPCQSKNNKCQRIFLAVVIQLFLLVSFLHYFHYIDLSEIIQF